MKEINGFNFSPSLSSEERTKNIIDFYNTPISLAIRFGIGFRILEKAGNKTYT